MTICACLIVRDEERIIERCLDSVAGLIDTFVVVDTGSRDTTLERIDLWANRTKIYGEVHEREWQDFGHNRSELMGLARGKADWLLLIDADMTLTYDEAGVRAVEQRHFPTTDAYMLRHAAEPEYWIKRLVRGDLPWRYVGATHEYLTSDEPTRTERLDAITIHHHYDGAYRAEKFVRDRQLLEAEHERDPTNQRTVFYLANTLRDLGLTPDAIFRYRQRAEMGGWAEEVFVSLLEAGRLDDDIATLFEAWSFRPTRAEPLYELAKRFREKAQWPAAHLVAEMGVLIPIPEDTLFVERFVYEWGLVFELSIAAWYVGNLEQAQAASDRLLALDALPRNILETVLANRRFLPDREETHGVSATP